MNAEAQLMALALGFYLWDSALLLHINEAALQARRKGRWQALFGARQVRLRGKELLLPNPLMPHRPMYLLSWTLPDGQAEAVAQDVTGKARSKASAAQRQQRPTASWEQDATRYGALKPCIGLSGLALFGLLPLCLFLRLGDLAALASLALMYLGILGACIWLIRHRRALDLPARRWWSLLLEGLLCPPLALNLLRKLSLARSPQEDFVQASRRLLPADHLASALAQCAARIDEELEGEAPDSARALALQALRRQWLPATPKERP